MAEQRADLDASEPATAHKLKKAHERGSVVRSADLTFAAILVTCSACVYGLGTQVVDRTALLIREAMILAGHDQMTLTSALAYVEYEAAHALMAVAPIAFAVWVTAMLIGALQAQGVFSSHPLKPDLSRLNPATGFKRVFSIKSLFELLRSAAKISLIGGVMIIWGHLHIQAVLRLSSQSPRAMTHSGLDLLGSLLSVLAVLMLLLALLEVGLNRWEFMRQMRMSKREIKDEQKEREGDPRIKRRLRELRLAWLKRTRQLSKVRNADVLLTNPTHYAVALEYRHGAMPAPMITARGAGETAQRMRTEARRRSVPVVENPPLTRALYELRESQIYVPEQHFDQVARLLRWVYAARQQHAARGIV